MADNVSVTSGAGTTIAADEVADGVLGTVKVQYVKLMDGTLDGTTKGVIGVNGLKTDTAAQGQGAHAAAIVGQPVRIGARALTANYAAVATGQSADTVSTLVGALIQKPYSIPEADWGYAAAASGIVNTTTAVTIAAAAGAGLRNYLTGFGISTDTLGAATEFVIRDGAAGTVIRRFKLQPTALPIAHVDLATPIKSSPNTLLEIATLTAVTGGVYFNAQGYIAP